MAISADSRGRHAGPLVFLELLNSELAFLQPARGKTRSLMLDLAEQDLGLPLLGTTQEPRPAEGKGQTPEQSVQGADQRPQTHPKPESS